MRRKEEKGSRWEERSGYHREEKGWEEREDVRVC